MSANLYKAVCARLLQVDFTERINICCLCLGTVGQSGASVNDEVVLDLPNQSRPEHIYLICGPEATTLTHILKDIMDESFSEVMCLLKSVCKQCMVAAINSFKFIQRCKDNAKIIATVVDNLEESFDEIPQNTVDNCNTLYVAVQPNDDLTDKFLVKRYYDKNRLFIPQDTAFLRFKQIIENVKDNPIMKNNDTILIDERDESLQELMCCKSIICTEELMNDPNKSFEYKCRVCQEIFTHSTSLRVHFFRVHRNKNNKCKKCSNLKTKTFVLNVTKLAIQQKPKQKRIVDENKVIEDQDRYEDEDHHYEEETTLQATEFIEFEDNNSQKHNKWLEAMKDIEEPVLESKDGTKQHGIYSCRKCNTKFSTRNRYIKHIVDKQYKCKRPPKGFGEFKCNDCDYLSFYKHQLVKHIKIKHLGETEGAFVCEFCRRNCVGKSELTVHRLKHTKEKHFSCDQCGRKYGTEYGLKIHKTIHTGETPYICHLCFRKFRRLTSLREHFIRHHEPATLKCKFCERLFKFKKELMRHEARHSDFKSIVSRRHQRELKKKYEEFNGFEVCK